MVNFINYILKDMKYYSNPYQREYWEAQKQKDQIDNEVAYWMIKWTSLFLALGVGYLLFKR